MPNNSLPEKGTTETQQNLALGTAPRPPRGVNKYGEPTLDPFNYPADYRTMERHAHKNGWRFRLKDGRVINADRERWPQERIDQELPALAD